MDALDHRPLTIDGTHEATSCKQSKRLAIVGAMGHRSHPS